MLQEILSGIAAQALNRRATVFTRDGGFAPLPLSPDFISSDRTAAVLSARGDGVDSPDFADRHISRRT